MSSFRLSLRGMEPSEFAMYRIVKQRLLPHGSGIRKSVVPDEWAHGTEEYFELSEFYHQQAFDDHMQTLGLR